MRCNKTLGTSCRCLKVFLLVLCCLSQHLQLFDFPLFLHQLPWKWCMKAFCLIVWGQDYIGLSGVRRCFRWNNSVDFVEILAVITGAVDCFELCSLWAGESGASLEGRWPFQCLQLSGIILLWAFRHGIAVKWRKADVCISCQVYTCSAPLWDCEDPFVLNVLWIDGLDCSLHCIIHGPQRKEHAEPFAMSQCCYNLEVASLVPYRMLMSLFASSAKVWNFICIELTGFLLYLLSVSVSFTECKLVDIWLLLCYWLTWAR